MNEQPSPADLAKAIEEQTESFWYRVLGSLTGLEQGCFSIPEKVKRLKELFPEVTNTAKQVQGLQSRNDELESINQQLFNTRSTTAQAMVYQTLLMKHQKLEQSSREQAALIEKLVEASSSLVYIWDIAGPSASQRYLPDIENNLNRTREALQLAHSKGYGKKG